jgi:hypothetical protein
MRNVCGTRAVGATPKQIYYMAAGFLLIIYIKSAPLNSPIDLARYQFMYDGVAKFWNFPIKLGREADFAQPSSRYLQVRVDCLTLLDTLKVVHIWYTTKT